MKTPICDFLLQYKEKNAVRLHMPGHKGTGPLGFEGIDLTEIDGADVLYSANGIIKESQENAAELFKTARTLYSTEGSSLSIRAMLFISALYAKKNGKQPLVLAARNAHKSFMNAIATLDLDVEWLFAKKGESIISCTVDLEALEKRLSQKENKPAALYITSPDYLGNVADIREISKICKRHGVLLLVDNAHGAYLAFLSPSRHPMALGADMCADSAHKTLPVITGGAYLHISRNAPEELCDIAPIAMQTYASTSPSYLILASLDSANKTLGCEFREELRKIEPILNALVSDLSSAGLEIIHTEPLKITVCPKSYGYKGDELYGYLKRCGFVSEFSDEDYLVMMFSPFTREKDIENLRDTLLSLPKKEPINTHAPYPGATERVLGIREAIMSPSEEIPTSDALGRILGAGAVSCPPAIPIAIAGERIDENTVECFKYYGYEKCRVIIE